MIAERALASPESTPCQNGEPAPNARSTARRFRRNRYAWIARSSSRSATCTWKAAVGVRNSPANSAAIGSLVADRVKGAVPNAACGWTPTAMARTSCRLNHRRCSPKEAASCSPEAHTGVTSSTWSTKISLVTAPGPGMRSTSSATTPFAAIPSSRPFASTSISSSSAPSVNSPPRSQVSEDGASAGARGSGMRVAEPSNESVRSGSGLLAMAASCFGYSTTRRPRVRTRPAPAEGGSTPARRVVATDHRRIHPRSTRCPT